LKDHQLKALNLRSGSIYTAQLYLIYANKENPGPGTEQLATIIRDEVRRNTVDLLQKQIQHSQKLSQSKAAFSFLIKKELFGSH
jgi:hypothetical protein